MDQNNIIGIIGAMEVEVQQLCSQMEDASVECISGITYTRGRLRGRECVVAMCGIGKVNAAMCAQTMILRYHPATLCWLPTWCSTIWIPPPWGMKKAFSPA